MTFQNLALNDIVKSAREHLSQNKSVHAFFDLDSTLFNVRPRFFKIVKEFAEHLISSNQYIEAAKVLSKVQSVTNSYHLRDHLKHFGLTSMPEDFYKKMYFFWEERFFHSSYIPHDEPYDGALDFVLYLQQMGVHIYYLTGRDYERMEEGSIACLEKHGFPLHTPRQQLIMKPHKSIEDNKFKTEFFLNFANKNDLTYFFENEPNNIHPILEKCPHVEVIYYKSVHSGRAEEPENILTISNFL